MEGFILDAETACQFYELCEELGLKTLEDRTKLMREFVKMKKAGYIRDPKAFFKDKNVLRIRRDDLNDYRA